MKIGIAIMVLSSFLLHVSCSCSSEEYLPISDDDFHSHMPYSNTDTLYFLHNGLDKEMFIGEGLIRREGSAQYEGQGCDGKTYDDFVTCNFRNLDRPGKDILFSEYFSYYQDAGSPDRYFNIKYGNIVFGGTPGSGIGTKIGPTKNWNSDSIYINGKYHRYLPEFGGKQIFYSVEEGIIKISLKGDTLQMIK